MDLDEFISRMTISNGRFSPSFRKDDEAISWLMEMTSSYPGDASLEERFFSLTEDIDPFCKHGSRRKFKSLRRGYTGCGRRGQCRCVDEKIERTNMQRYGGISPYSSSSVREKSRSTVMEKYGVESVLSLDSVKEKSKESRIRNGTHQSSAGVIEKIKKTCRNRFGKDSYLATDENREIVNEILKSTKVKEKRIETNLKRYGFSNPMLNEEVREKHNTSVKNRWVSINGTDRYRELDDLVCKIGSGETVSTVSQKTGFSLSTVYLRALAAGTYHKGGYRSDPEMQIGDFLESLGVKVIRGDRSILGNRELDIVVPEVGIAIEHCGLYWHSEVSGKKDKHYHLNKLESCKNAGIRLITVFHDEWEGSRDKVKSRLMNLVGKTRRGAPARKCDVRIIDWSEAAMFLETHHLQGKGSPTSLNYGAFYKGRLVGCMTFSSPRVSLGRRSGYPEMVRFCTDGDNHPGLASKLLRRFIEENDPEGILTYADRRWSDGGLYKRLGFDLVGATAPGYWYTNDYVKRHHRFGFRKSILVSEGYDRSLTEWEIMRSRGYDRIWDCGNLRYLWRKR